MKTNYFVVEFDFTEGAENATIAAVEGSNENAIDFISAANNEHSILVNVWCEEGKYRLVSMTEDSNFSDFGETDTEKDACNALREEVETMNLYPIEEITMEDEGRGDDEENDDEETEHIFYGLYEYADGKRVIYFVVGE